VMPGLSFKQSSDQADHFVFSDGKVMTFNDEIACERKGVIDLEGAVKAQPLISLLRKMQEEVIEIGFNKKGLRVVGKKRKATITGDPEVKLGVDAVEKPTGWKKLHPDWIEALSLVEPCAGTDQSEFVSTVVHITPELIEATDGDQLGRFSIPTPIDGPLCIRKTAAKHVVDLAFKRIAVSDRSWVHFKTGKLRMSCRICDIDEYPSEAITKVIKRKGDIPLKLPRSLAAGIERAQVFTSKDSDIVQVVIGEGELGLKAAHEESGRYFEQKKIRYSGEPFKFRVKSSLLLALCERYNECLISETQFHIDMKRFHYVTSVDRHE
jgi:hypothetical protein